MSKYTTEVRYICEHDAGLTESAGYLSVDQIVEDAAPHIFEEYPIFDEEYRIILNKKILRHYYTREICAETVGLWKLWLNNRMNEIMPYYNKLYLSELLDFDPFKDVDLKTVRDKIASGNDSREGQDNGSDDAMSSGNTSVVQNESNSANATSKYSDTPQGSISDLAADRYLTNATIDSSSGSANTSGNSVNNSIENRVNKRNYSENKVKNDVENYLEKIAGKRGNITMSEMLEKYRKTFLNIDMMIIRDLSDMFFQLW